MLWIILASALAAAALASPVRVALRFEYDEGIYLTLELTLWRLRLPTRTLLPRKSGSSAQQSRTAFPRAFQRALWAAIRRDLRMHRFRRRIRPEALSLQASLAMTDAARTALSCGIIAQLPLALPATWRRVTRWQVLPDPLGGKTRARGECIFSSKLGTILLCAARVLLLWLKHRPAKRSCSPSTGTP